MVAVVLFSTTEMGRRLAVLFSGAALVVPCFICVTPLARGLFGCLMALPFVVASTLVFAPSLHGFRAHLFYMMSWCGKRRLARSSRQFGWQPFVRLIMANLVCGGALAMVPRAGNHVARWLSGGIATLAFAEMATMAFVLLTGVAGVSAPLIMDSPHLARSLAEFWSRRWNPGASELLFRRYNFQPLARCSPGWAMAIAFVISGLLHFALAYVGLGRWRVSLACGAFFFVQPAFVATERWLRVRTWRPAATHAWTIGVLAITSPLFVEPLLQLIESSGVPLSNIVPVTALITAFVFTVSGTVTLLSLAALPSQYDQAMILDS